MLQVIIKNGEVLATHQIDQDISGGYPGCEIIWYDGVISRFDGERIQRDPRLIRDPRVRSKRPPSRMVLFDADGNRHLVTVAGTGQLETTRG